MAAYDDITSVLDFQQLAQQVGADPAEVERAVHQILPALVGGMQANAADQGGATSLLNAVSHHDNGLANGLVNLAEVDTDDGARIARHVFGANTDQVISQLGRSGSSDGLIAKLLPLLAPIVLSYLAKQMGQQMGGGGAGGVLGSILGSILSSAASGSRSSSDGFGLDDLLGGLLGGGTRS